jgi:hypothetical protein
MISRLRQFARWYRAGNIRTRVFLWNETGAESFPAAEGPSTAGIVSRLHRALSSAVVLNRSPASRGEEKLYSGQGTK